MSAQYIAHITQYTDMQCYCCYYYYYYYYYFYCC
jgi:hypothetical protein